MTLGAAGIQRWGPMVQPERAHPKARLETGIQAAAVGRLYKKELRANLLENRGEVKNGF